MGIVNFSKQVILVSENPLARSVAPLLRALSIQRVQAISLKIGERIPAAANSIAHCFGLSAARAARRSPAPKVITISEEPAENFIGRIMQKSALRGAKLVATSRYIASLWKIKTVIFPGLNLDIFNPEAIPARRQTDILSKYNIPHDRKMIVCSSPVALSLPLITAAARLINRDDFIIAMLGNAARMRAGKMMRSAEEKDVRGKVIFIGDEPDIPSLMKSAYATVSTEEHEHLAASIAIGTPTIATDTEFAGELAVNWLVPPDDPYELALAINAALDLTEVEIERIMTKNAKYAREFLSIKKTAEEYIEIYSKL